MHMQKNEIIGKYGDRISLLLTRFVFLVKIV